MKRCRTCVTSGRRICVWCFVQTAAFPLEHFMWERVPVLRLVPAMLGLS